MSDYISQCIIVTALAGDDLSGDQFRAVGHSAAADNTFIGTTAQGQRVAAICLDEPTAGQQGRFCIFGPTRARFGAAVTRNAVLTPQADGDLETAASGDFPCGYALESGADGGRYLIFFCPSMVPLA